MRHPGKSSKASPAAGFVFLLILGFAGQAFANKKPKFVYAVNECGTGPCTNVWAYSVDSTTGALSPVPGSPFAAGAYTNSVAVDPSGKFAYVANLCPLTHTIIDTLCGYSTVSAYTINSITGALTQVLGSPFKTGTLPFSVAVDPSGKFVYVTNACFNDPCSNLAGNVTLSTISAYTIDRTTGALNPVPGSPFATGAEPVSVAVDPSGKFAYVANQCQTDTPCTDGDVWAYTISSTTGALSPVPGSPFAAGSNTVSVAVDPSGKFAYVANIGACNGNASCPNGNVSAYSIDNTTGALSQVSGSPFAAGPGSFSVAVDPSGKFVLVVNAIGTVAYTINSTTGALNPVPGSPFAAGTFPTSLGVDPSGRFTYVAEGAKCNALPCPNGTISAYAINSTTGVLSAVPGSPFAAMGNWLSSLAIASQPTVPFAAFKLWAWIDVDRKTSFEVAGLFTLGAESNGVNPLTEDVTLQVGNFSTTIPAGSFKQKWNGASQYKGFINGVDVEVAIYHIRDNRFWFTAEGKGQILTGIVNPVTVGLTIGDDEGSIAVSADIDR